MRIPQSRQQKIKAGLHFGQALLIFVAGCLTLAVMRKSGGFGDETGFFFGLCFLSFPGLVYQVMVPMWTRAWRFANIYAYAAIDILYAILWFGASIAVAAWNAHGIAKGAKDDTSSTSKRDDTVTASCETFYYGSATKCNVSKASVGLGILIFLLYCATSAMAVQQILVYRRTGIMPNGSSKVHGQAEVVGGSEDAGKDVWSADVDEVDHAMSDQGGNGNMRFGGSPDEDGQQLLHHHPSSQRAGSRSEQDGLAHPGMPVEYAFAPPPPAYGYVPSSDHEELHAPSALSPTIAYDPPEGQRAQFPRGDYGSAGL